MRYYRNQGKKDYSEVLNQLRNINSNISSLDSMLSSLKRKMADSILVDRSILKNDSYNRCNNNVRNIRNNINSAISNVSNRW